MISFVFTVLRVMLFGCSFHNENFIPKIVSTNLSLRKGAFINLSGWRTCIYKINNTKSTVCKFGGGEGSFLFLLLCSLLKKPPSRVVGADNLCNNII